MHLHHYLDSKIILCPVAVLCDDQQAKQLVRHLLLLWYPAGGSRGDSVALNSDISTYLAQMQLFVLDCRPGQCRSTEKVCVTTEAK